VRPVAAPPPPPTSRRAVQRAERRGAILDATIDILITEGLEAVTHRAVAKRADVPLAATTYYFDSKDALIGEALSILVADEIERLSRKAEQLGERIRSPRDCAAAVAEVLFPDAESVGALLARLEVYLEAARRPVLRERAAHWQEAYVDLAREVLTLAGSHDPERMAPLLVAAGDGILVHALSEGVTRDSDAAELRTLLEQLFTFVLEG
jgi:DNA-binding transcriptional regulator YbjK